MLRRRREAVTVSAWPALEPTERTLATVGTGNSLPVRERMHARDLQVGVCSPLTSGSWCRTVDHMTARPNIWIPGFTLGRNTKLHCLLAAEWALQKSQWQNITVRTIQASGRSLRWRRITRGQMNIWKRVSVVVHARPCQSKIPA